MRKNTVAALLGVGLMAGVTPLAAWPTTACSTSAFQACASVSVSKLLVSGVWKITLVAKNLFGDQGVSHVMTTLGVGSATLGDVWAKTATVTGLPGGWVQDTLKPNKCGTVNKPDCFLWNNNFVGAEIDAGGSTSGIGDGISGGEEVTLVFSTTTNLTGVDDWVVGWHSQAVNGTGCSLWVDSNNNTVGGDSADCSNVVPEPVTMVLLGTGLASMGGFGLVRRRKRNGDIEST
jgi:hypothetical protein